MNEQSSNNSQKREFDWGPPANSFFDTAKEWLVYLLLLALFGMGIWFFKDVSAKKSGAVRVSPAKVESAPEPAQAAVSAKSEPAAMQSGNFLVQLGAFADRKSAESAIQALQGQGFTPMLSEPDSEFEIYRVSIGPFNTEFEAEKTVEKLNSLEFHSFVVESF